MDPYIQQQAEKEREYEGNRMKKVQADKALRTYFWIQLAIAALIFGTVFFAGAAASGSGNHHGWGKFSNTMEVGIIQIFIAVFSLVLGFIAGSGRRPATFVLIAGYLALLFWMLLSPDYAVRFFNAGMAVIGTAVNLWVQKSFTTDEELKNCPGYPSFQLHAEHAEYHPSVLVTANRPSDHMETIGGPEEPAHEKQQTVLTAPADAVLDAISEPERRKAAETLTASGDIALRRFADEEAPAGRTAAEQPLLSPEGILEDMTAEGSGHRQGGDPSMLPDPEEVRARLAAMREQRNQQSAQ